MTQMAVRPVLHDLADRYVVLLSLLEGDSEFQGTAEEWAALAEQLGDVSEALERKSLSVAFVIEELELRAREQKAEADRMAAKAKRNESRAAWLRDYLIGQLDVAGINRVETSRRVLRVAENPDSVEITDIDAIPVEFKRTKLVVDPDKIAIKKELQQGVVVPGARLTRGRKLVIS